MEFRKINIIVYLVKKNKQSKLWEKLVKYLKESELIMFENN